MVGVQLSGGLGNQMFEYALYLKLKSRQNRRRNLLWPTGKAAGQSAFCIRCFL